MKLYFIFAKFDNNNWTLQV